MSAFADRFFSEVLNHQVVSDALTRAGGDPEQAAQDLAAHGRLHLERHGGAFVAREVAHVRQQLRPAGFARRAALVRQRAQELRQQAQALLNEPLSDQLHKAEEASAYWRVFPETRQQAEDSNREVVRLRAREHLVPEVAEFLATTADAVAELGSETEPDLQVFSQVRNELQHRLLLAQPTETGDTVVPDGPWLEAGQEATLAELARLVVEHNVLRPLGDLRELDPSEVAEELVREMQTFVLLPPSLAELLSESQVEAFLHSLPLWAGVDARERLLFSLSQPTVLMEAPRQLTFARNGFDPTLLEQTDPHRLSVRVFKLVPLPAIEGFEEWVAADRAIRDSFGGVAVNSAEPWCAEATDKLLEQFQAIAAKEAGSDADVDSQ